MRIEDVVLASFRGEVEAFKPGNVSIYADGHDMAVDDFIKSAEAATPLICHVDWSLGQRLLESVKATRHAAGCNTNLGMLLLFTPLVMAAERGFINIAELRRQLQRVLASLDETDAVNLFAAISLASPGGLGRVEQHDVNNAPTCSVLEAMQLASSRDYVAAQYVNGFADIFGLGLDTIKGFVKRWNSVEWATVACYLEFLSLLPDSHIERKFGKDVAEQVQQQSGAIKNEFYTIKKPQDSIDLLRGFDKELKEKNMNPGTSADLAATSLLVYNLTHNQE